MSDSIEHAISAQIAIAPPGSLFFTESFIALGNTRAVAKALERLTNKLVIKRLAPGVYCKPEIDPIIGPVSPPVEAIVKAIANRDKARIVPTGVYALNRLGLSTQVPLNLVYLTDGAARKIKIGKRTITFKKATPKNLAAVGPISQLAIQALRTIGKNNLTPEEYNSVVQLLHKEKPENLRHDMALAPEWIRQIFRSALNQMQNEPNHPTGMAATA